MPSDFLYYYLVEPSGIVFQLALFIVPLIIFKFAAPSNCSIGSLRMLFGYLGITLATLIMSLIQAYLMGQSKVNLGHIATNELSSWVFSSTLYLFVLLLWVVLFFTSLILVPSTLWLSKKSRASISTLILLAISITTVLGLLSIIFPVNNWAQSHRLQVFLETFKSMGLYILVLVVAFGLGLRLPLRRTSNAAT